MESLILAIVQAVSPLILQIVQQHHAETGQLPTVDDITAKLHQDVGAANAKIDNWFANNPNWRTNGVPPSGDLPQPPPVVAPGADSRAE